MGRNVSDCGLRMFDINKTLPTSSLLVEACLVETGYNLRTPLGQMDEFSVILGSLCPAKGHHTLVKNKKKFLYLLRYVRLLVIIWFGVYVSETVLLVHFLEY